MLSRLLANAGSPCLHFQAVAASQWWSGLPAPPLSVRPWHLISCLSLWCCSHKRASSCLAGGYVWAQSSSLGTPQTLPPPRKAWLPQKLLVMRKGIATHAHYYYYFLLQGGRNMSIFQLWKQAYRRSSNLARVTIIISSRWV